MGDSCTRARREIERCSIGRHIIGRQENTDSQIGIDRHAFFVEEVPTNVAGRIEPDGFVFKPGKIGIVSKSGTLTYEAADQVVKAGLGISTAIGIGGDPVIGTSTRQALELFMQDPETDGVIMIGEIGGGMEAEAARWLRDAGNPKPVVGFIAGQTAPPGRRMGHAGAIVGGKDDTAEAKMRIMSECGIHVVASPAHIGQTMADLLRG